MIPFLRVGEQKAIFGVFGGGVTVPSSLTKHVCPDRRRVQTGGDGRGHDASSPASSLLSTVETGVGATAAFLISGWRLCDTQRQKKSVLYT